MTSVSAGVPFLPTLDKGLPSPSSDSQGGYWLEGTVFQGQPHGRPPKPFLWTLCAWDGYTTEDIGGGIGRMGHLGGSLEAYAETPVQQQPLPFFTQ